VINIKNIFNSRPGTDSKKDCTKGRRVDKNIRMVILEHTNSDKMDSRYGLVDGSDLLIAVDPLEVFLQSVDQNVGQ
jgi:hypothetical protein